MLRALVWKEWRTQRSLVLGALVLAGVLPIFLLAGGMASTSNVRPHEMARALLPLYAMLVWPVFAAATGGSAFAADMGDESMRFLLSRPVSRARVWLVKVGVALAAFFAVVVGTTLMSIGFLSLTAANGTVFRNTLRRDYGGSVDPEALILAIPFVLLFGCSIYCSTVTRRPLLAALCGFVVAASLIGAIWLVWSTLLPHPSQWGFSLSVVGPAGWALASAVAVCVTGYRVFCHGEILGGASLRRAARPLVAATAFILLLGAVPAVYAGTRQMAAVAALHIGNLAVADDTIVFVEKSTRGFTTEVVRRPLGDAAPSVVVAERATAPTLSPNGGWVVYAGYGSYFAGPSPDPHLRAARVDGGDDHAISGPLEGWDWGSGGGTILVAPDNDHVAFIGYDNPVVTSISGRPEDARELDLLSDDRGVVGRDGGAIGWSAGDPAELLYYRVVARAGRYDRGSPAPGGSVEEWGDLARKTELLAFDPRSGESRQVQQFPGVHRLVIWGSYTGYSGLRPTHAWEWLPVWLGDDESDGLQLVETTTGEVVDLGRSACGNWGFAAGGNAFVYGRCGGDPRTGDPRVEIRLRHLVSGADEPFVVLEGYRLDSRGREMFLSPDGRRLLVYARRGDHAVRATHLIGADGSERMLAEGFLPLGWRGDTEAILFRFLPRRLEVIILNVETGQKRVIFP